MSYALCLSVFQHAFVGLRLQIVRGQMPVSVVVLVVTFTMPPNLCAVQSDGGPVGGGRRTWGRSCPQWHAALVSRCCFPAVSRRHIKPVTTGANRDAPHGQKLAS